MPSEAEMEELIRKNWDEGEKSLDLGGGRLKAYSAQELEQLLRIIAAQKPHVEELYVGGNGIGDEGARRVADALPALRHLKLLGLGGNCIGDEGARRVADALPSLRHLKLLGLYDNKFGKDGAATIAEAALPFLGELENLVLTGHPKEVDWGARGWVQGMPSAALGAAEDAKDGDWNWGPMLAVIRRMTSDTPELLPQHVRARLTGHPADA